MTQVEQIPVLMPVSAWQLFQTIVPSKHERRISLEPKPWPNSAPLGQSPLLDRLGTLVPLLPQVQLPEPGWRPLGRHWPAPQSNSTSPRFGSGTTQ